MNKTTLYPLLRSMKPAEVLLLREAESVSPQKLVLYTWIDLTMRNVIRLTADHLFIKAGPNVNQAEKWEAIFTRPFKHEPHQGFSHKLYTTLLAEACPFPLRMEIFKQSEQKACWKTNWFKKTKLKLTKAGEQLKEEIKKEILALNDLVEVCLERNVPLPEAAMDLGAHLMFTASMPERLIKAFAGDVERTFEKLFRGTPHEEPPSLWELFVAHNSNYSGSGSGCGSGCLGDSGCGSGCGGCGGCGGGCS
ncbi:MAG: hypothetical protein ACRCYO_00030 [Bacteroidia bacterium]